MSAALSCHSIHAFKDQAHLLKASQPTLCYGCHTDVKPDFSKPFHHKVEEGLMSCSDCHNPHGTFQKKGLKSSAFQGCGLREVPYRDSRTVRVRASAGQDGRLHLMPLPARLARMRGC